MVIHWYGGPGLQLVSNRYGTTNIFNLIERDTLYTQAGFIVWRLDNRGSFGRGHAFETPIAGQLGPAALDDQLAGVEYLKTLPYVDAERIGTDGKSFGGFLTLYALIHAARRVSLRRGRLRPHRLDILRHHLHRALHEDPGREPGRLRGHRACSTWPGEIQAAPLIIHGLADTNVHLQNSVNFIQALEEADKPFYLRPAAQ